jgi:UDPglucose 6-dehydrogenase
VWPWKIYEAWQGSDRHQSESARKIMQIFMHRLFAGNPILWMKDLGLPSMQPTHFCPKNLFITIARLCELLGADVDICVWIGSDDRIGKRFLFPGIGYGGSCFPKDVQALVRSAADVKYDFRILDAVMEVNEKQKVYLIPRIKKYFNNNVTGKKIALWGLAFKPNTDDIREAPALYIIEELLKAGATVTAFDPEAMKNVRDVVGDKITFTENQYDALNNCDALIIATEWSEFRLLLIK